MKSKIKKIGDPCRHCGTPVVLKECKFNEKKLKKSYYYTAYLWCPYCQTMYMLEKYKIVNEAVVRKKQLDKESRRQIKAKKRMNERYKLVKGGINREKYQKYLRSVKWKGRRDKHIRKYPLCYCCNVKATEVHHNSYERLGKESKKDLVSLCRNCHQSCHDLVKSGKTELKIAHEIQNYLNQ